jgi:hypothetical protein
MADAFSGDQAVCDLLNIPGLSPENQDFQIGFHFNGVIANGGNEVAFIESDPGTTFVVKAKKM